MFEIKFAIISFLISLKWKIFGFYYNGLLVQARYLYRQSPLFRYRWKEMGLDFAERAFDDDAYFFLQKAKKEPLIIRARIFLDGLLGREFRPYYLGED